LTDTPVYESIKQLSNEATTGDELEVGLPAGIFERLAVEVSPWSKDERFYVKSLKDGFFLLSVARIKVWVWRRPA
jgi:hypothetical protein